MYARRGSPSIDVHMILGKVADALNALLRYLPSGKTVFGADSAG